jgi:hypothetical protein
MPRLTLRAVACEFGAPVRLPGPAMGVAGRLPLTFQMRDPSPLTAGANWAIRRRWPRVTNSRRTVIQKKKALRSAVSFPQVTSHLPEAGRSRAKSPDEPNPRAPC